LTKAQSEKRKVKSAKWKRKAKTQFIKPPHR